MSFVPSVMSIDVVRLVVARFVPMHHTLRKYARAKLSHIAPHLSHTLSSRCVCECVLQISSSDMS